MFLLQLLSRSINLAIARANDPLYIPVAVIPAMPNPNPNPESFETRARREDALRILESNELLFWYSSARNESIPQTRLHFSRILANLPAPALDIIDVYDDDADGTNNDEDKGKKGKVASPRPMSKPSSRVNKGSGSGTGSAGPSTR